MSIHDLPQWALPMYAAAWRNYEELRKEPLLTRADVLTVDAQIEREMARTALEIIYDFAVAAPAARQRMSGSTDGVRRHIVRSQCLTEMRGRWTAAWRDVPDQEYAFNHACRVMGWVERGGKVAVTLWRTTAHQLGIDPGERDKINLPGVLLTDGRQAELEAYLFGGGDLPPEGEQEPGPPPVSPRPPLVENPKETAGSPTPPHASYPREENTYIYNPLYAYPRIREEGRAGSTPPYLEGAEAVIAARAILISPGLVGIDFETYPTDPAWHGKQAADAAPHGQKAVARQRAEQVALVNGRAHLRRSCTLQLVHEDGREIFVRLEPGDNPEPRRSQLRAMFDGRQAELVAHRSQFETEILLGAGMRPTSTAHG